MDNKGIGFADMFKIIAKQYHNCQLSIYFVFIDNR